MLVEREGDRHSLRVWKDASHGQDDIAVSLWYQGIGGLMNGLEDVDGASFSADQAGRLLRWARGHGRDYPWRAATDPYAIVVVELMLVRTRADQVAPVWIRFLDRYPTLESLAAADDKEVREALAPLGLRWRAGRIIAFARAASSTPDWFTTIESLPGGGPYVAAAARLAVTGRGPLPVDVTIARAISRYNGLEPQGEARRDQGVLAAAAHIGNRSRRFFHAWLDLAATICTPKAPKCVSCPLRESCQFPIRRGDR